MSMSDLTWEGLDCRREWRIKGRNREGAWFLRGRREDAEVADRPVDGTPDGWECQVVDQSMLATKR
jgi:hypothetical protein